jgi:hypothetical protein
MATELKLERKLQLPGGILASRDGSVGVMMTPELGEGYWSYRVKLSDRQAMLGFPKFGQVGIGFAAEDADWNTNLPSRCPAERIYQHIKANKGDSAITRADCIAAIRLIQEAVEQDRAAAEQGASHGS